MNRDQPVIIIGGGIAGLACAIALHRAGRGVRVFEGNAEPRELGAGITLWSNAMAILARWGLADALVRQGNVIESGRIMDWRGRLLIHTPVGEISRESGSIALGLHRGNLLRELLAAAPAECVTYAADCIDVHQDADGVTAVFADGTTCRSAVLIGADGIRSAVFRALYGDVPLSYAGYVCFRGIAPYAGPELPAGHAFETWGPGRRFGAIRLDAERVYWFANETADAAAARDAVDIARLQGSFASWPAPTADILAAACAADTFCHAIHDRAFRHDHQGRGRVTLAGDAAHPMTPDLGQGACQAIEDAAVLAQCLASSADLDTGLRNYEKARWRRVRWMVRRSRFQGWVGQHPTRLGCWLRNLLIRATPDRVMRRTFRNLVTEPEGPEVSATA